jgi:hypothetical protein
VANDPYDPSPAGPWLPDPQEPDAPPSQPPVVPHGPAGRRRVARKPVSPWLDEPEDPEPATEGVFEQAWFWCRCNPIFSALMAAGTLCLVGAIGGIVVTWHSTAASKSHAKARPGHPAPVALAPR